MSDEELITIEQCKLWLGDRISELEKKISNTVHIAWADYYQKKIEVLEASSASHTEKIDDLMAYNDHTFDAQLKENADIIQENKQEINELKERIEKEIIHCSNHSNEINELKELLINTDTLGIVYLKGKINELKEKLETYSYFIDEHQMVLDNQESLSGEIAELRLKVDNPEWLDVIILDLMKPQFNELKEQFEKREEHQFQDYFKLQRFEVVLRELGEEVKAFREDEGYGTYSVDKTLAKLDGKASGGEKDRKGEGGEDAMLSPSCNSSNSKPPEAKKTEDIIYCEVCGCEGFHAKHKGKYKCFQCIKDSEGEKEMGYEVATTNIVKGQHPSPTNSKPPEPNYDRYMCDEERDVFSALDGDKEALKRLQEPRDGEKDYIREFLEQKIEQTGLCAFPNCDEIGILRANGKIKCEQHYYTTDSKPPEPNSLYDFEGIGKLNEWKALNEPREGEKECKYLSEDNMCARNSLINPRCLYPKIDCIAKRDYQKAFKEYYPEPREPDRLCLGCSEKFEGGVHAYMCGTCTNKLLNEDAIIVKREHLQELYDGYYSNGTMTKDEIEFEKRIKEEYGIE